MGRAQLQGIPWHEEQLRKTCKDGSKYCVYNHKICSNNSCKYYHKQCVGKGICDWFEPKTGTPKIYSEKIYKLSNNIEEENKMDKSKTISKQPLNEKHKKFIETAEKRVNDIVLKIEILENLSNKNTYEYSNDEVEKMFGFIEESLNNTKQSFLNKNKTRFKF